MASPTPPLPTCHATDDAHPKMSGHLAVQLRSIAPQSFMLLGQLRGVAKSSVLTCSISWGAAPSLAPITSPHSRHGAGIRKPPARWLTRSLPPSLSRFLSVQNRWAQAAWEPPPFPPPDPAERCIAGAGSNPLPAAAQHPFQRGR